MLANHPVVWELATLPPAAPSQGLCCTTRMLASEGVTTTSLLQVKSCSPSRPLQAKRLRTSIPADEPAAVLLRQIAFPGAGGAEWDNDVPTEPLQPVPRG